MTLHGLGEEYSAIGADILNLLGKRAITIATGQTGLLRAAFLKSSGKVVEAWHLLGATIRDAQELGLHSNPTVSSTDGSDPLRIWITLHIWDIHMAVVLGRPITTQLDLETFIGLVEDPEQQEALFSHWRSENDPPKQFDIILAGYNVAYKHFPEIHRLGSRKPQPQDPKITATIHASVEKGILSLPSWCRLENPDTKFDSLPECQWLPIARDTMASLIHLVLLTLHRPFMFTDLDSCRKAVRAGHALLHAQERSFQKVDVHECKVFNPVYASFDAIVLVAAAHLAFPGHLRDLVDESLETVEKGVDRLEAIGQHNPMAKSAHSVVVGLYHRVRGSLPLDTSRSTGEVSFQYSSGYGDASSGSTDMVSLPSYSSGHGNTTSAALGGPFHGITPPQPVHDFFYNHLTGPRIPAIAGEMTWDQATTQPAGAWDFEGIFSDASFWGVMNSSTI